MCVYRGCLSVVIVPDTVPLELEAMLKLGGGHIVGTAPFLRLVGQFVHHALHAPIKMK